MVFNAKQHRRVMQSIEICNYLQFEFSTENSKSQQICEIIENL